MLCGRGAAGGAINEIDSSMNIDARIDGRRGVVGFHDDGRRGGSRGHGDCAGRRWSSRNGRSQSRRSRSAGVDGEPVTANAGSGLPVYGPAKSGRREWWERGRRRKCRLLGQLRFFRLRRQWRKWRCGKRWGGDNDQIRSCRSWTPPPPVETGEGVGRAHLLARAGGRALAAPAERGRLPQPAERGAATSRSWSGRPAGMAAARILSATAETGVWERLLQRAAQRVAPPLFRRRRQAERAASRSTAVGGSGGDADVASTAVTGSGIASSSARATGSANQYGIFSKPGNAKASSTAVSTRSGNASS